MLESELICFLGYPLDCPGDDERLEAGFREGGGVVLPGAYRRISIKPNWQGAKCQTHPPNERRSLGTWSQATPSY